jgi:uncharacterized protein (DUF58 family)
MYYPTESKGKLKFAAYGAAIICNILRKQRDAFALTTFASKIQQQTDVKSSTVHFKQILSILQSSIEKTRDDEGDSKISDLLHQIAEKINRRSMVCLFTDMFDSNESEEALLDSLRHLKYRKHEIIIFHVVDGKHELQFEFDNRPYKFVDVETGEKLKLLPNEIRDQYIQKMSEFKKRLISKCHQYQIEFVECDINQDFNQILMPFLVKRQKMF